MRIIFLGDCITTQQAGIHYYARNLLEQIIREFPQHNYSVVLTERLTNCSIDQIVVPLRAALPFHLRWRQLFIIPAIINKMNPDLVIELAHFGPFNLKPSIKRITVIHDLTPLTHAQWHPLSSTIMHRFLMRRIIRKASFIITNSEFTKVTVANRYGKSLESILVSNPQLSDMSEVSDIDRSRSDSQRYFLTVGTLEPRKNHVTIIRAFDHFCQSHEDFQLIIAGGEGWKNREFFDVLNKSPNRHRISLTGYLSRDQLLKMYSGATAFIFASYIEGFGVPILEATYFSLPLILSRNASLPHWFAEAGLLFDPADHLQLARYMSEIARENSFQHFWAEKSAKANFNYLQVQSDLRKIFNEDFR